MTPMDADVDDMANIKPMLDRATKIQRHVSGELQWRVIVGRVYPAKSCLVRVRTTARISST